MKKLNGVNDPKTKKGRRYTSINDLPEEIQNAIKNMKVTYTVESIFECIHPDVKKALEEKKANS